MIQFAPERVASCCSVPVWMGDGYDFHLATLTAAMNSTIDLTECARRVGWLANKSGRESVRRCFLMRVEDRDALAYDVTTGRGTVDEAAFMIALKVFREERRSRRGPVANLGAHARKGVPMKDRKHIFRAEREKIQRATRKTN